MDHRLILELLRTDDSTRVNGLYAQADQVRRDTVGNEVFLRGLLEISNHCRRNCAYCGMYAGRKLQRYRMSENEILDGARRAVAFGHGTIVLQAGEDGVLDGKYVAALVTKIRNETDLAVTLSLGEREPEEYELWREAGADRYLLRFETSNPELYRRIHPPGAGLDMESRLEHLRILRRLGYEVGSGVMVGIPGSTWDDLANDIALFADLDLDMVGIGPYLPHPDTPLVSEAARFPMANRQEQVPNDEDTTCRVVALTRIALPRSNIPATTALSLINRVAGRMHGLARGANIIMPNITPIEYKALYEIYPAKADSIETAEIIHRVIAEQLAALGRSLGVGRGDSRNWTIRRNTCKTN